jgi:hypothetical protein
MVDLNEVVARQHAAAVAAYRAERPLSKELDKLICDDIPALVSELRVLRSVVGVSCQQHCCTQKTNCARCGKNKHTPLRRDEMGGYVCLTCVDKLLDSLGELVAAWRDHAQTKSVTQAESGAYAATANCANVLERALRGGE